MSDRSQKSRDDNSEEEIVKVEENTGKVASTVEVRGHMLVVTTVHYTTLPLKDLSLKRVLKDCVNFTAENIAKTWLAAETTKVTTSLSLIQISIEYSLFSAQSC